MDVCSLVQAEAAAETKSQRIGWHLLRQRRVPSAERHGLGLLGWGIVEVGRCSGRAVVTHEHAGQLKMSGNTVTDFLMWYLPVFPFANQNWYTPDFLEPATGCVIVVALWRVARLPFLHLWPCPATVHGLGWGFCAMSPDPSCWPAGSRQCVWWLWPTSLLTPDGNVVTVSGVTRSE